MTPHQWFKRLVTGAIIAGVAFVISGVAGALGEGMIFTTPSPQ